MPEDTAASVEAAATPATPVASTWTEVTDLPLPPAPAAPVPRDGVWRDSDLEALARSSEAQVSVTDEGSFATDVLPSMEMQPGAGNADLAARYQQALTETDARIAALEQERLAAANPLLRGLSPSTGGKPTPPRPLAAIDADLLRMRQRRDDLSSRLSQAQPERP